MSYGGMEMGKRQPQRPRRDPAIDKYRENVNKMCRIMEHGEHFRRVYGDQGRRIIDEGFRLAVSQLDNVAVNKPNKVDNECIAKVQRAISLMMEVVIFKEIDDLVRDFTIEASRLFYNWAREVGQRNDIMLSCMAMDRMVKGHYALLDAINTMKKLIDKSRRELNFSPSGFELSRHYLLTLRDKEQ